MDTLLSALPLRALLVSGARVVAVVTPSRQGTAAHEPFRRLDPRGAVAAPPQSGLSAPNIAQLAGSAGLPRIEIARLAGAVTLHELATFAPEFIVVSCFPLRLPPALLALPAYGALNVHPALLPQNRGPAPLFWTFRDASGTGPIQAGVTVHLMTGDLDAGPIVVQEALAIPDGLTGAELEARVAALASQLVPEAITGLVTGRLTPRAQDDRLVTTHGWPSGDDFVITTDRPARWAFNVIRGTAGWGQPLRLRTERATYFIRAALGFEEETSLRAPVERSGDLLRVRCAPGVLTVAVAGHQPAACGTARGA